MKCDFIIIGSGIIGLTLAYKLKKTISNSKIIILEKEHNSIQHGSGRNSGVIHSGIYYDSNSLRATLGVRGGIELKEYIKSKKLWIDECGKILIPTSIQSFQNIDNLYQRGIQNGVLVQKISQKEIQNLEPNANTKFDSGLFIPFTSVADPKEVSKALINDLNDLGVKIIYNEEVTKIIDEGKNIITKHNNYFCDHSFNCSGLQSDAVAKNSGLRFRYSFLPFKGKYWKIKNKNFKLKHLIYPIPDLRYPFLGLHTSHKKDGSFYIGPSSTPVFGREQYHFSQGLKLKEALSLAFSFGLKIFKNENRLRSLALQEIRLLTKNGFFNEVQKLINNVSKDELEPSLEKIGIRSQIFDPQSKSLVNDFVVINQKHSTHVLNAISPAWTASFAFADHLINLAKIK
jgi:L-2-hydroxyglutarate oxidase